jgi:hypothetical protein
MRNGRPRVGTLAWAKAAGGALSPRDRLELLGQALTVPLARMAPYLTRRRAQLTGAQLAKLRPPDSALAKKAEALCQSASSPLLYHHCQRTYLWGRLLGALGEIRVDDELFYVACLLHDLGLTPSYATLPARCFSVKSALAAKGLVDDPSWAPERREALEEAITLHMNLAVDLSLGPEAHLLNAGAGLDVVGARAGEVPKSLRDAVVAAHPRLGMTRGFHALLQREADTSPGSRAHFLVRFLGFGHMVLRAPFAD